MQRELFEEITRSVQQAGAIARGERKRSRRYAYSPSRVQAVREGAKLSQAEFARLPNGSVRTLRNWEQARRVPTRPAKVLLRIVEMERGVALRTRMQSEAVGER
jgi:putative transcriptional regulator